MQENAYKIGCSACGKPYNHVIDEKFSENLQQIAELHGTNKERLLKRRAFMEGLPFGLFTFFTRVVSQTATCDGQRHDFT